jgi:signal transduction histidine kinase
MTDVLGIGGLVGRLLGDIVPRAEQPLELSKQLPPEPGAAPKAREALEPLAPVVGPAAFENLRLLVSELVTNSVRHGPSDRPEPIEFSVVAEPHRLRAEVADGGGGFAPPTPTERPDDGSGWGLYLVDSLSDRWGIERNGRTVVWFELEAEVEPEWWLSDPGTSEDAGPRRLPEVSSTPISPVAHLVRRLPFGWLSLLRSGEPESDLD